MELKKINKKRNAKDDRGNSKEYEKMEGGETGGVREGWKRGH